ncbi:hypothetical protein SLA2020_402790 [Shorea laevis]
MPPCRNSATGPNAIEFGKVEDNTHPKTVEISMHKAINSDSTQLLATVTQLVTTLAQEREARQPERE